MRGNVAGCEPGKGKGKLLARRRIIMNQARDAENPLGLVGDHDLILLLLLFLRFLAWVASA